MHLRACIYLNLLKCCCCCFLNTCSPCFVGSSEGSVIAYYLSEFSVPVGQEAAVDRAMNGMDKLVDKVQRTMFRPGNALVVDDVMSSGRV